jgi:hypothetical protein
VSKEWAKRNTNIVADQDHNKEDKGIVRRNTKETEVLPENIKDIYDLKHSELKLSRRLVLEHCQKDGFSKKLMSLLDVTMLKHYSQVADVFYNFLFVLRVARKPENRVKHLFHLAFVSYSLCKVLNHPFNLPHHNLFFIYGSMLRGQ